MAGDPIPSSHQVSFCGETNDPQAAETLLDCQITGNLEFDEIHEVLKLIIKL